VGAPEVCDRRDQEVSLADRDEDLLQQDKREEGLIRRQRTAADLIRQANAPFLVLAPSGQESLVKAIMDAGADYCLILPIDASMLLDTRASNGMAEPSPRSL